VLVLFLVVYEFRAVARALSFYRHTHTDTRIYTHKKYTLPVHIETAP